MSSTKAFAGSQAACDHLDAVDDHGVGHPCDARHVTPPVVRRNKGGTGASLKHMWCRCRAAWVHRFKRA